MAIKSLAQSVGEIEKEKTKAGQIKVIQENDSKALRMVFEFTFDPMLQWLVPDSEPPYRPASDTIDQEGRLYSEIDKLVYFTNTPEGLNAPDDAKLLLRMRRKELKVMIWSLKEVYPQMTGHWK